MVCVIGEWSECGPVDISQRLASSLGPARRVAESPFLIVTGQPIIVCSPIIIFFTDSDQLADDGSLVCTQISEELLCPKRNRSSKKVELNRSCVSTWLATFCSPFCVLCACHCEQLIAKEEGNPVCQVG